VRAEVARGQAGAMCWLGGSWRASWMVTHTSMTRASARARTSMKSWSGSLRAQDHCRDVAREQVAAWGERRHCTTRATHSTRAALAAQHAAQHTARGAAHSTRRSTQHAAQHTAHSTQDAAQHARTCRPWKPAQESRWMNTPTSSHGRHVGTALKACGGPCGGPAAGSCAHQAGTWPTVCSGLIELKAGQPSCHPETPHVGARRGLRPPPPRPSPCSGCHPRCSQGRPLC
jgi:hypothetical protein